MTRKEEAALKKAAKLEAEKARTQQLKLYEQETREKFHAEGSFLICGIDEAGRGPFAGPVVAGAVILDLDDPAREILYLNDSKKLSEKKREMLYKEILQKAVAVGIGYTGARIIDQINILQATYRAMRMAISNLQDMSGLLSGGPVHDDDSVSPEDPALEMHSLVSRVIKQQFSGEASDTAPVVPDYILADAVTIPQITIPQQGIIKGDAKSISIAAASIIAKVTRDHIMYEYDRLHPEYGFASHKGYGTAAHIAAIKEHGMLDIHRRSFIHL